VATPNYSYEKRQKELAKKKKKEEKLSARPKANRTCPMTIRPMAKTAAAHRHRPILHPEVAEISENLNQIGHQPLIYRRKQLSF
jgi:hypothetical protein